jgi:hypothetical protein
VKIFITYEKKDMLRLVQREMQAQGIKLKAGTSLEYKGALQIRFYAETEDDAADVMAAPTKSDASKEPKTTPVVSPTPGEEVASMDGVLAASKHLVMTEPGKFEQRPPRRLVRNEMMQESAEFPGDKEE